MNRAGCFIAILILLALVAAGSPGVAAAQTGEQLYGRVSKDFRTALSISHKEEREAALRRCIQQLQSILQSGSQKGNEDRCLYLTAQCYHEIHDITRGRAELKAALEYYKKVVERFPSSSLADDSQYLIGVLHMQNDPAQAYEDFKKVSTHFPNGDMRQKALEMAEQIEKRAGGATGAPRLASPAQTPAQTSGNAGSRPAGQGTNARAGSTELQRIQHWAGEDYTRVAVYTSAPVTFEHQAVAADPRRREPGKIILELNSCSMGSRVQTNTRITDATLQAVKIDQVDGTKVRVVLESSSIQRYRIFSLADPARVIIDMRGDKAVCASKPAQQPTAETKDPPAPARASIKNRPTESCSATSLARQLSLGVKRIVLDPGHGGKDKGAISPNNTYEKDIALAIAKELKTHLEAKTGCEVLLTRTRDRYLSLEERTAFANARKADLFVSIHTNAHTDRSLFGTETYFLNLSKDKESARVAAVENATSTKRISDLEAILHDLMLNAKLDESSRLAEEVQRNLVGQLRARYDSIRDLGTKQAPFYVLLGAEMPSVLVETAFLTNEREENRLRDRRFQTSLADAIASGIESYIQEMRGLAKAGGQP